MVKPALKLVDVDVTDRCGAECSDGTPCLRQTGGDRCFQHSSASSSGSRFSPPDHLGDLGREEWHRRIEEFSVAGTLGSVDLGLLEAACEAYEEARQCRAVVKRHGRLIQGRTGMKKNPAHAKMLDFRKEYRLVIREILRTAKADTSDGSSSDPFADADF